MKNGEPVTGANAGGPSRLPIREPWAARIAQFCRSVKNVASISVLVVSQMFCGCGGQQTALIGTWRTGLVPSEWGTNRITVKYLTDGRLFGTNDFGEGRSISCAGTYRVRGGVIERTIQGRTDQLAYRIEGDTMHMDLGDEHYKFTRIITEPAAGGNAE